MTTGELIRKWRVYYKKFMPVYSKTLNETVSFNSEGFNHLIFARGHKRTFKEISYRLPLLIFARRVIRDGDDIQNRKIKKELGSGKSNTTEYIAISLKCDSNTNHHIKVIVRKKGANGNWNFFSIMKK